VKNCIIDEFEKSVQILDLGLYRDFEVLEHQKGSPAARLFKTLSDFEIQVKSEVEYLNYYV
jgi:hypothetical protein